MLCLYTGRGIFAEALLLYHSIFLWVPVRSPPLLPSISITAWFPTVVSTAAAAASAVVAPVIGSGFASTLVCSRGGETGRHEFWHVVVIWSPGIVVWSARYESLRLWLPLLGLSRGEVLSLRLARSSPSAHSVAILSREATVFWLFSTEKFLEVSSRHSLYKGVDYHILRCCFN